MHLLIGTGGNDKMFVCCREHIEIAIDEFVDEYEDAPDLYKLAETSFTAWTVPARCDFCEEEPIFLVV
ncbi:CxxH/CxxC protein (TIGR04129 family) [Ammoniphilus resinae]|uniref:CxxH/CxxC protein (TIGR04129 family) n=2 Tax=Ammoniphilus resinae TaxID=861532 RepID=A0ABS4GQH6_9BACL|nr:CxxH/CxxC protein (TIGR04129 family) [Ammoniphilus resinae]